MKTATAATFSNSSPLVSEGDYASAPPFFGVHMERFPPALMKATISITVG
jgi:hypothetical protein